MGLVWIIKFGSIFKKPRDLISLAIPPLEELFKCSLCLGFWIGLFVGFVNFKYNLINIIELLMFPFASSAFCWFVDSVLDLAQMASLKIEEK